MPKKRNIDQNVISHIADNMFAISPLLKKRILQTSAIQREHGLPLSQVQILTLLSRRGSVSVSDISKALGIAKPNITPLVDKLYKAGYVERIHDDNDRRVVNVALCEAGRNKLDEIRSTVTGEIVREFDNFALSPSDYKELDESLDRIVRILSVLR